MFPAERALHNRKAVAHGAVQRLDIDDGWDLEEAREEPSLPTEAREPERRGNIVRLPGKVVIYPRRAVREKRLASFWRSALAEEE